MSRTCAGKTVFVGGRLVLMVEGSAAGVHDLGSAAEVRASVVVEVSEGGRGGADG